MEKEVLKNELENDRNDKNDKNDRNGKNGKNDNRFLINPEFVQSLDESDGSKAFDFNGEGTEGFDWTTFSTLIFMYIFITTNSNQIQNNIFCV